MSVRITQYPYPRILGYFPIRQSSKGGFVFCREVRGHPHRGQAANLWLVPHLGHSVGGLPPEIFSPLQAALMRAKFFALRLPVHSGRFGFS